MTNKEMILKQLYALRLELLEEFDYTESQANDIERIAILIDKLL
jgi:hypothetical protein